MSDDYSISKTNQELLAKAEAAKKIHEHNRDYLSVTLTLPLGDKALKNVHTNQWLFTNLPAEFDLANWTVLAEALNSNTSRYEGYVENRWYIEAVDISVESGGKAEMRLTCNAFASSYNGYVDTVKAMEKAFNDTLNKNTSTTTTSTTNAATTKTTVLNKEWIKKYSIPKAVYTKAESICKLSNTEEANVKAIFNWMSKHVKYVKYRGHYRNEATVISKGGGNCVDSSRLFRSFCLSIGVKCNFVQNTCTSINHQYNKVYINGKGVIVDCGRGTNSWGSNWGGHSSCGKETSTSW